MQDRRRVVSCLLAGLVAAGAVRARGQSDGLPRGCHLMPYVRYESESGARGGGAVLRAAPDFNPDLTASEASQQQYVGLPGNGAYVQWTNQFTGDGVTLRFTLPDNATGTGVTGSLDLFTNGAWAATVNLGSYWSWTYFPTSDPVNTPGARPRMRFDEIRVRLPGPLQPGDVLRVVKSNGDAYEYGVDFVEVESVPAPLSKPAGFVSVADYGASGLDTNVDTAAFNAAWAAARAAGTGLYLPPGKYLLNQKWNLGSTTNLAIQGAGFWFTELFFTQKAVGGGGVLTGETTTGLEVSHFYMNSALNERHIVPGQVVDYKAFTGPFGSNSSLHHLWINHFEVGVWPADYTSPIQVTTNLDVSHCRIRNVYADGVNFAQGTRGSTVRHSDFRDNGDDALAVWTSAAAGAPEGRDNAFHNNTIEFTYRAAGIGIFGGDGHAVHHNIIRDNIDSAGIRFTEDFSGYRFTNTTGMSISENTISGSGTSFDLFGSPRGAIEIRGAGIQNLFFDNNDVLQSPRHAIQLNGGWNLRFSNTTVNGTGLDTNNAPPGAALYVYGANGSADFVNLSVTNCEYGPGILQTNLAYQLTVRTLVDPSPYEMELRFTGYTRAEVLTNCPVLVGLGPHRAGFSYAQFASPDGYDLRFRDTNGTELRYEVETWNSAGTSWVWVQVPALSSNLALWAGWGAPARTVRPAYTTNGSVWTAGYAAVYHAGGGGTARPDSSPNARHAVATGNTAVAAGVVGGADVFDGNGDAVRMPPGFGLFGGAQAVTVECWFKANAVAPGADYLTSPVLFQARAEHAWMLTFGDSLPGSTLGIRLNQGGWATPVSVASVQTNRWYHLAAAYAPSGANNWKLYLDGVLVSQATRTGLVTAQTNYSNFYGGSDEPGGTRWFNGVMDEVRVSGTTRSSNWIWASWRAMASPDFITCGAVQEVGPRHTFAPTNSGAGVVNGSPAGTYVPGATVIVSALASAWHAFVAWTGDVPAAQTNQNPLTLILDQDRAVTAVFVPLLATQGVPQAWLAQYGWTNDFDVAALADADGDGFAAWQEYRAGTHPREASSALRVEVDVAPGSGALSLTWPSASNRTYRLERATELPGPWVPVATNVAATPPVNVRAEIPPVADRVFYRLVVE